VLTFGLFEKLEIIQNIFSPSQPELESAEGLRQLLKFIVISRHLRK